MTDTSLSMLQRCLRIGADRPLPTLLFILVISLIAAWGAQQLRFATGAERLIADGGGERQAYLQVAREFGSDNRSFIILRDDAPWTPVKLDALRQLHEALGQLPYVERVDSVFSSPAVLGVEGQLYVQPLLSAIPTDETSAEQARAAVLANPLAQHHLVSPDGKTLIIGITLREGQSGTDAVRIAADLERTLDMARSKLPSLEQLGPARIEAEAREALLHDLALQLPVLALVLALTAFAYCRSKFAAAMPVVVGALSLLWTCGMMGLAGMPAGILSALLPVLAGVAGTVIVMRMFSGSQRSQWLGANHDGPSDRKQVTDFMVGHFALPLVLTVLIMALGFASSAFAGIPASRDFGLAAGFAILASGLIAVLLVPALYSIFGSRRQRSWHTAVSDWQSRQVVRAVGLLRRRLVLWPFMIAALAGIAYVQQTTLLHFTNDPLAVFRQDRPLVRTAEDMHEEVAGSRIFYITLDGQAEGAFRDPDNLRRLVEIQAFIAKQQIFDRSLSLADVIAQANQEAAGGRPEAYQVPATRKLVGQYLMLYTPQDLEPYVSHDLRRANIVVRHNVSNSSALNQTLRELRQAVASYAGPGMVTMVAGENLLIHAAADRLLKTHVLAVAALLLVVFVAMSLMFTSVKGGIIALVPSVAPILLILGGMRILDTPINAGTLMVAIITIGIAVEGTIHLFAGYSDLCRSVPDYEQAVLETVRREAAPMIAISLALALGCATLWFSELALVAQCGVLAAATLLFSIFANLLIMPLVMSRMRLIGLYELLSMSMQREALVASPLFNGMTDYQIRKTILISELREYRQGECLIRQGTVGRSMYLVVSGQLEVVRHEAGGSYRRALLGPGEVFGEIGFVHETTRIADVCALGPVAVLCFDHARLKRDLTLFPFIMAKLNFNISGILGRRLVEVVEAHPALPTFSPTNAAANEAD